MPGLNSLTIHHFHKISNYRPSQLLPGTEEKWHSREPEPWNELPPPSTKTGVRGAEVPRRAGSHLLQQLMKEKRECRALLCC